MPNASALLSPSVVEDLKHRGTEVTEWMVAETSVFSVPLCFDNSLRWFGTAGPWLSFENLKRY